eukprot:jgi/Chrzof1/11148/Cz05g25190.t1
MYDKPTNDGDAALPKPRAIRTTRSTIDRDPSRQLWLDAWADPVAEVRAFSSCIHTCNLFGDGDWRLVVADADKKLKVWKGTHKSSENALLDVPVAITSFIADSTQPKVPALAVACGAHIYMFRNLRPFYKFVLPTEPTNTEEQNIWKQLESSGLSAQDANQQFSDLQNKGVQLTARSLELLSLSDPDQYSSYVQSAKGQPLVQQTCITCMDVIKQALDEPDAVSCLVIGTEDGRVSVLNSAGTAISKSIWIGAPPTLLATSGTLDLEYRITVAARNGVLYNIKSGVLSKTVIQLEAQPVGLVRIGKSIIVGCMNDVVHCYTGKGQKTWSIYLPASILSMQLLATQTSRMTKAIILALSNGEVRVYNNKMLVSTHTSAAPITGLFFGRYGREDNTLITLTKTGALDIKILPRGANLEVFTGPAGPPPEQDVPLAVPKKTKLYVEQTQRERENAVDMHRVFQRDLCKLRLKTARAYVKVLTDGQGPASHTSNANLSMNARVQGLGPRFSLLLSLRNEGNVPVTAVQVTFEYNTSIYDASKQQLSIPLLVPMLQYEYQVSVRCLDPAGPADSIRIVMVNANSCLPMMTATVKMPISEIDEE